MKIPNFGRNRVIFTTKFEISYDFDQFLTFLVIFDQESNFFVATRYFSLFLLIFRCKWFNFDQKRFFRGRKIFRFFFVEPLIALSRNAVLMSVHYIHSRLILNILFWVLSFHWLRDGSTINCTQWYSNQYCESVTKHVEFVSKLTSKITVKSTQLSFLPAKNGQNDQKLIESAQIWPKMI